MTLQAKYPGTCRRCGVRFPAGTVILWEHGVSAHATAGACETARAAAAAGLLAPKAAPIQLSAVAVFLGGAQQRGLKFPKVRFLAPGGGELRLSVAGPESHYPGAVQVKLNHEWIGRVTPDGAPAGPMLDRPEILSALATIGADPAKAATAYAAQNGRCSFCNLTLTDAGSIEVGYGPICATRYGLPHTSKGPVPAAELAPEPGLFA